MKKFMLLLIALAIPSVAFCDPAQSYKEDRKALQKCILYEVVTKNYWSASHMAEELQEPVKGGMPNPI